MDLGTVNQNVAQAQQQGQLLQQQYNQQAAQRVGEYNQAYGQTQTAQQGLQDFTRNMISGQDLYGQNLSGAQQEYGFNPQDLLRANQALAHTATTIANLPQAVQQQGNYYGTTAGQEAASYGQQAANLASVQQGQANAANAFQAVMAATQAQAEAQTGAALTAQQQKLAGLQAVAQNATAIMDTARNTMNQIETLQQQQGTLTAQQVSAYQNAYSNYVNAQAAAESASANMLQAQASAAFQNLKTQTAQKLLGGATLTPQEAAILGVPYQAPAEQKFQQPSLMNQIFSGDFWNQLSSNAQNSLGAQILGWLKGEGSGVLQKLGIGAAGGGGGAF